MSILQRTLIAPQIYSQLFSLELLGAFLEASTITLWTRSSVHIALSTSMPYLTFSIILICTQVHTDNADSETVKYFLSTFITVTDFLSTFIRSIIVFLMFPVCLKQTYIKIAVYNHTYSR